MKAQPLSLDSCCRDAALDYAAKGYPVFPLMAGQKVPATQNGYKNGTTDAEKIRKWWGENPNYNVGLCTTGLCVVDVDRPKIGGDNPWPATLGPGGAAITNAPTATTPSGGTHHVFRVPDGQAARSSVGKIAPSVDVRADGGYIVAGPSSSSAGAWSWTEGRALPAREELPVAPPWLLEEAGTPRPSTVSREAEPAEALEIEEGNRNDRLTSVAGMLRRNGFPPQQVENLLLVVNDDLCVPPLPEDEVRQIARSISRHPAGKEFAGILTDDSGFQYGFLSADEFLAKDFDQGFLIEGAVVQGEHLVLGGPQKAYKTSIAADLCVSIATGSPFLGHFTVNEPRSVLMISSESGGATLQRTTKAVLDAKGNPAFGGRLHISTALPNLTLPEHLARLEQEVEARRAALVLVDPAYLTLLAGKADAAGNVFAMGDVLREFGAVGTATGCTMFLVHHTTKSKKEGNSKAPGLASLSQSGFAEWTRQWILLNHRSPVRAGQAQLNMAVGGSAGHWGEYKVDIDSGDPHDALVARKWEVTVHDLHNDVAKGPSPGEERRAEKVLEALETFSEPTSKNKLTKKLKSLGEGYSPNFITEALSALESRGKASTRKGAGASDLWEAGPGLI